MKRSGFSFVSPNYLGNSNTQQENVRVLTPVPNSNKKKPKGFDALKYVTSAPVPTVFSKTRYPAGW